MSDLHRLLIVALLAAQAQAPPPRDTRPAVTGAAVIRGRVVAADTGRPLGLATITARAPELPESRSISTNAEGRYELRNLPAGRYTLSVSRNGYLTLGYGQTRPLEQGRPIQLAARQALDDIDFVMPRASAISGRVTDEQGDPIPWAQVFAAPSRFQQSRATFTDDLGRYRISDLGPGSYLMWTQPSEAWPSGQAGRTLGFPKTYFPDSPSADGAQRVQLRVGEEASNVDLSLTPVRASTVSGTMVDSRGRPLTTAIVGLMQAVDGALRVGVPAGQLPRNGTFRIPNVMPGAYTLVVRGAADGVPLNEGEGALMPVAVNGSDFEVAVTTSMGWSMSGRVSVDGGASLPRNPLFLRAAPLVRDNGPVFPGDLDNGRVKEDGTFSVKGVYGQARLMVNVPDGWIVRAIRVAGRDVSGKLIEAPNGETLAGVEVVLTNRPARIAGTVTDANGSPAVAGTVILFSDDSERWFDPLGVMRPNTQEFIRATRPDQSGSFQMNSVPPGGYLAIAVDYAPDRIWFEPSYLESLRPHGQRITIADGESKTLSLMLVTP